MSLNVLSGIKQFIKGHIVKGALKKGFEELATQKVKVVDFLDDLIIGFIRPLDIPFFIGKDEQDIKDKTRLLIRVVLVALLNAVLAHTQELTDKIVKTVK